LGLIDAGRSGFRIDSSFLQRDKQIFAAQPFRFRDLVNPLFRH
jgi:hypothetical protein